jgi:hypothetical protein
VTDSATPFVNTAPPAFGTSKTPGGAPIALSVSIGTPGGIVTLDHDSTIT